MGLDGQKTPHQILSLTVVFRMYILMRLRLGEIKEIIVATEDSIKDGGILKKIGPLWVNRIGHLPSHVSSLILNHFHLFSVCS